MRNARWCQGFVALLALCGMGACDDPPCAMVSSPMQKAVRPGLDEFGWADVGRPVAMAFAPILFSNGCLTEDDLRAGTATFSVVGPDNQPVAFDGGYYLDEDGVSASAGMFTPWAGLHFTPKSTGLYHVTAEFQPYGGRAQADLMAMEDRTEEAPFRSPSTCEDAFFLSPSALVCDDLYWESSTASPVRYLPKGSVISAKGGSVFALTGDAVWHLRSTEGGVPIVDAKGLTSQEVGMISALLPREDDAIAVTPFSLVHLVVLDGGVFAAGSAQRQGQDSPTPFMAARGDRVYCAEVHGDGSVACGYTVSGESIVADAYADCQMLPGTAIAGAGDTIYSLTHGPTVGILHRLAIGDDGGLIERRELSVPEGLAAGAPSTSLHRGVVPTFAVHGGYGGQLGAVVLHETEDGPLFEHVPMGDPDSGFANESAVISGANVFRWDR